MAKYKAFVIVKYEFEFDTEDTSHKAVKYKAENEWDKIIDTGLEGKYYQETIIDNIEKQNYNIWRE